MKKKLIIAGLITLSTFLIGCNQQIIDTTWSFQRAIIFIGDERLEVEVKSWKDYDDTTIQIKAKDGTVYLTDVKNVLMISK